MLTAKAGQEMALKIDKRDKIFSKLVRERANWTCERCGKNYMPPTNGLHCAHIWTRRGRATRWHHQGAIAACYGCHSYIDSHPVEKEKLAREILGDEVYDVMMEVASRPRKLTKSELEECYYHLREEYERMRIIRKSGKSGRIEFIGY